MNTISISPIELQIGDKVAAHGATFEVVHIVNSECQIPGGVRVAACISRLTSADSGSIPRGWLDTAKSYQDRGCGAWASALPEGEYFNVQGNAHARVSKIVD